MDFLVNLPLILLLTVEYNSLQLKGVSALRRTKDIGLKCPRPFGLFPHPQNCSKFLNCAHNKAYVISCATGTLFNPRTSSCDFEHKVQCSISTPSSVTTEKVPHEYIWRSTTTPKPHNKKFGLWEGVGRVVGGVLNAATAFKSEIKNATMKITRKLIKNKDEAANAFKNEIRNAKTKIKRNFIKNKDEVLAKTGWDLSSKEKDATLLCLKPKGQFPYPKDCSKFINCWQGKPSLMVCPDDLVFDASTHTCGWPGQAICTLPSVYNDPKKKSSESLLALTPYSGQNIRLRRGGAPYVGYLQVWFKDDWRAVVVLAEDWKVKDDICLNLGFSRGAHSETRGLVYGWSENHTGQKALICNSTTLDPLKCPFQDVSAEFISKSVVGIRCRKNSVSECPPKWHRWGKKCYFVDTRIKKGRKEAKGICESKNGRLLSISSQAENDFVSYLLATMSGSSEVFYSGGSTFYLHDERYWLWEGTTQPLSKSFGFQKWWPGWDNKTENISQPELETKKSLCICLRDTFPLKKSTSYQKNNAKYFFWELCDCKTKLNFVCEMEPLEIGCITGRGENYNGKANITLSGAPCLHWDTLGPTHKGLSQITTLRENFCSNPDGDDLPWCYVTKSKLEFCDIPRCPFHEPIKIEHTNSTCSSGSYTCADAKCIHLEWVCDGQKDCSQGEEEENCPDYSHAFLKHSGFALGGSEVEKWLFSPKTTCAIRCMQAKNFICHSFNYQESTSTCILSKSNAGKSGGLAKNSSWEYHERVDLALNCSNTFVCSDYKCLPQDQVCDGRRHCVDGEDEKDCFESDDFQLRLINGSQPHEGRIEVKVFDEWQPICDDMWGIEDGNVACKELGFQRGAKKTYTNSYFGSGLKEFVMDDMNCNGDETSLALCNFAGWGEHDCSKNEAAGVVCNLDSEKCSEAEWECANSRCIAFGYYCDHIDDCGDGSDEAQDRCLSPVELRLGSDVRVSSEGLREGRVELKYQGIWGTVCDDDITLSEGHVLCRMLGFEGASSIFKNGTFGPGEGPIWIDGLQCRGHEHDVMECQHDPWGLTNCNHSEDVGVRCTESLDTSKNDFLEFNPLPEEAPPGVLPPTCGVRYVEDSPKALLSSPRVVDGHIPRMGANPWMAGLRRRTSFGSTHECGAFILTEDLLMTAAHCVWKYPMAQYLVRTGDYNNEEKDPFEEEWALEEIWEHPRFDKGVLFNNDIAIIRIKRKAQQGIQFNEQVQPICLVEPEFEYTSGLNCTVAGWGTLGHASGYSRILQSSLLPLLPDSVCREDYVYGPTRISSGMFCAGYLEGGIDTCQGDSGGPLVCQVQDRFTAVGITSWGHGCARANKPGVYTKLTHYLDWIYNTTQELKS